jgi:hypothetical protein
MLNTWVMCLMMASLVVIIDIAMTTNMAPLRLLNSTFTESHPRESGDLKPIGG